MKVLVVGAGMYVTGRGGYGNGTVLSALAQTSKNISIAEVVVVAKSPENKQIIATTLQQINEQLNTNLNVRYLQIEGTHLGEELQAICTGEKFDCAIVSTPDHLHFEPIKVLIKNKISTLVVKPLVPSLSEAKELINLQEQYGVYGVVEFHKRYDESNLYVKKILDKGSFGKLLYVSVDFSQRVVIPTEVFKGWVEQANVFQYLGVHYVDMIYFITRFLPTQLVAYGTEGVLQSQGINALDSVHVMIEWQNRNDSSSRFVSQFNTNWIDPNCSSAMSDQKYKIVGTKGRIECDQKNRGIEIIQEEQGISHANPYFSEYLPDNNGKFIFQGYGFESISQFIKDSEALKNKKVDLEYLENRRATFKESLVSTVVIEAVNNALKIPFERVKINGLFE